ncbi:MAG TPA: SAM-dependent methyltransferase [Steroidobacteraceae bacterium]|nr:SAM-dependent methyltransferase [Steroidobacteraceae bacterium]
MLIVGDPPPLSAADAAHGACVAAHIRGLIEANGGWLPFSRFMEAALYAPGLGYYMAERARFGPEGDFVTAPELSPLFQACLADFLADALERTGGGEIVEFGAGSGSAAAFILPALERRGSLPARYRIVEPSPDLARRQRQLLERWPGVAAFRDRIEWLDAPPRGEWQGVAFGNEVVDALPVERFRVLGAGCEALGVVAAGDGFAWQSRQADAGLAAAVASIQSCLPAPMPAGYVSECRPELGAWFADATAALGRGAVLFVDYGLPRAQYYHPSRDGGTLCGFRRHRRVADPLATPGVQDLTAWVDFSALADAAMDCGMAIGGFATQAHFLIALGIERHLAEAVEGRGERDRLAIQRDAATIMLPGEMGERFKAIAFTRGIDGPLPGFSFRDLRDSL